MFKVEVKGIGGDWITKYLKIWAAGEDKPGEIYGEPAVYANRASAEAAIDRFERDDRRQGIEGQPEYRYRALTTEEINEYREIAKNV